MKEIEPSLSSKVSLAELVDRNETVSLALAELTKAPLLTAQEEIELSQAIEREKKAQEELSRNGNFSLEKREKLRQIIEKGQKARTRFVESNTRLVVSTAKKYQGRGIPFLDLVQEGCVGLMTATEKFDWRWRWRFSTYACWWIRQGMMRAVEDRGRTIRLPGSTLRLVNKISRTETELQQEGHQATVEKIAERLQVKPATVKRVLLGSRRPISLEKPVGREQGIEPYEFIADQSLPSPEEAAFQTQLKEAVEDALLDNTVTPREAFILKLRYGLRGDRACTLEEIGRKFGLTRQRIQQLEKEAFQKLRNSSHGAKLRRFLS